MDHLLNVGRFMLDAFIRILPFILISIPFSVFVNLSGKSVRVGAWFRQKPLLAIGAAVIFGSVSPLCSCTVIPVIYSLLLSGVPLGPVMAFWIASPSMDPEIFFLSLVTIGTPLAIARIVTTFVLSFLGGLITHLLDIRGFFGTDYLRQKPSFSGFSGRKFFRKMLSGFTVKTAKNTVGSCCSTDVPPETVGSDGDGAQSCCAAPIPPPEPLFRRIVAESSRMSMFIMKFILLALFLEALIIFYLPEEFIPAILSGRGWLGVPLAALLGIPFYTSSLAALGIVSGLMTKGLSAGAALAFLIAGPTTTLPAMTAVFGITRKRVFLVYLALAFAGSLIFGWLYSFLQSLYSF